MGPRAPSWLDLVGTWVGTYTCDGRSHPLTLIIEPRESYDDLCKGRRCSDLPPPPILLTGTVTIASTVGDENPGPAHGEFTLRGQLTGSAISFEPIEWQVHPTGIEMFGLSGELSSGLDVLSGQVLGVGCDTFSLRKIAKRMSH